MPKAKLTSKTKITAKQVSEYYFDSVNYTPRDVPVIDFHALADHINKFFTEQKCCGKCSNQTNQTNQTDSEHYSLVCRICERPTVLGENLCHDCASQGAKTL